MKWSKGSGAADFTPIDRPLSAPPVPRMADAQTEQFTMPKAAEELPLAEIMRLDSKQCDSGLLHVLHAWEWHDRELSTAHPHIASVPVRCEGNPSGASYMGKHCYKVEAHVDHLWNEIDEVGSFFGGWYCDGKLKPEVQPVAEDRRQRKSEHCGINDVHNSHDWEVFPGELAWCGGVDSDGRGLFVRSLPEAPWRMLDPYPIEPDAFDPGVLGNYARPPVNSSYDAQGEYPSAHVTSLPEPLTPKDDAPLFGFYDEEGRTVVEFRVFKGKVEARYYPSDLDAAAQVFIDHVKKLADGSE